MFSVNILFEDAEDPIEDVTLTAREGGREGTRSMFVDGDSGRLSVRALKKYKTQICLTWDFLDML